LKHLILLSALICFAFRGFAQNNPPAQSLQGPPPTIEELKVADHDGYLGNRRDLIRHMRELDSDFVFKQKEDVNGHPDFYASNKYNTTVEIIGDEYNIVMVQWTLNIIQDNRTIRNQEIGKMGGLARGLGNEEGLRWFSNICFKIFNNVPNEYSETKQLYLNRIAVLKYSPQLKNMTLMITLKKYKP